MKTTDLPLNNHIDVLSTDDLWVVVGIVKGAVGLATKRFATKRFWLDPVYFKLGLPVRNQIFNLASKE
jgi:hypothetical protein